jgi:pyruvate-ferredoxin/flavodoxin oxidoreductase
VLERRRTVVVVEALGDAPASGAPLLRELSEAVGAAGSWVSAICAATGPQPAALAALCKRLCRPDPPRRIDLERLTAAPSGAFPRRQALLQAVSNAYPQLLQEDLPEPVRDVREPDGARSVALLGIESQLPPEGLVQLGEAMVAEAGACLRGTRIRPAPGVIEAHVRVAPAEFDDLGPRAPVEALWVATEDLPGLATPLPPVAAGGLVLLATNAPAERVWSALPPAWRHAARQAGLRLLAVEPVFEAGLEAVRAWLRGEEAALLESGSVREVAWRELPDPDATDRELPRVVSRIAKVRPAHDSLPRFWGEVVQPRQAGAVDEIPDPLTAAGAVPAGASALAPPAETTVLPLLDPTACTGCGRCWSACPDSAIGATALDTEALFTAASRLAATSGRAADALRRAHKHLAARLGGELGKDPAAELDAERCRAAWSWLAGRLDLGDEERPDYEVAFDATLAVVERLQPVTTAPLFREPEQQKKGAGALLVLAVDPRSCLGCGLCVSICPEDALRAVDRTPERTRAFEECWQAWEKLPDTPGETLARVAEHPDVGRMAALLLSRHCAQAQVGGTGGEPGSGERLAARLVTALVEHHAQRCVAGLLKTLEERRVKLEQSVREHLAEGLSAADLNTLEEALAGVTRGRADLSELGGRLDALGTRASFDRRTVLRMTRVAGALDAHRQRLAEGVDGLGRARFGVVVARGRVGAWAAHYPRHPYHAPLGVAPTAEAVELARGVARGLVAEHLALIRSLRRAELEAEPPPDRTVRLEAIEALSWEALETHERAACPPLLLLGDDAALLEHGFEALTRLLDSGLPVKVILLDGLGRLGAGPEPALLAMAHRRAFVLAASPAHPDALAQGLSEALGWPGPALIHVHAPSPQRHGFPPEATLERARLAVEGRAHVLLRYDPAAEGLFGLRASLQGNPGIEQEWGGVSFAEWAAGEARFASHFEPLEAGGDLPLGEWLALPEREREGRVPFVEREGRRLAVSTALAQTAAERLAVWNTLRELTGAASPFTARIRAELATELAAERRAELEALHSEHEARIAELRAGTEREALERMTERLLQLSGFASGPPPKRDGA